MKYDAKLVVCEIPKVIRWSEQCDPEWKEKPRPNHDQPKSGGQG